MADIKRVWFSGRMRPCQGRDPGSIPGTRTKKERPRIQKDRSLGFQQAVPHHVPILEPNFQSIFEDYGDNYVYLCIKDR